MLLAVGNSRLPKNTGLHRYQYWYRYVSDTWDAMVVVVHENDVDRMKKRSRKD
jgi:hypothetical protein